MGLPHIWYHNQRARAGLSAKDFTLGTNWGGNAMTISHSNADGVWNIVDHEGLSIGIKQNEFPMNGLRRVANLLTTKNATSLTNATETNMGSGVYRYTATANGAVVRFGPASGGVIGRTYVARIGIRRVTGTGAVSIDVCDGTSTTITSQINTSTFVVVTQNRTQAATTYRFFDINIGISGDVIEIFEAQLQDKTGATTNTIPDEYVDPTVNFGFGVVGVRQFATTCGNSVDANKVVTEGAGTAISGGYLGVWESRTNLFLQSADFGTTWTTVRSSISTDQIASPGGAATADKFIEDNTASATHVIYQTLAISASTAYCVSVFAKAGTRSYVQLVFATINSAFANQDVIFNLSTGAVHSTGGSLIDYGVEDWGNGWYRCWAAATSEASPTGNAQITLRLCNNSAASSYTGDGASYLYLWGAQMSASKYPSAYLPTTTASVTRNALSCYEATPAHVMAGQPFTIYREIEWLADAANLTATAPDLITIRNATASVDACRVSYNQSTGELRFTLIKDSSTLYDADIGAITAPTTGDTSKVLLMWDGTSYYVYYNGALIATLAYAAIDAGFERIYLARADSTNNISAKILSSKIYRGAWSSAKAIAETTV